MLILAAGVWRSNVDFDLTCKNSNKLSATSVSLAQSAENNTTRCSCKRQDSTCRAGGRRTDGQAENGEINVSFYLFD